jgi:hypothetical protein
MLVFREALLEWLSDKRTTGTSRELRIKESSGACLVRSQPERFWSPVVGSV